MIRKNEGCFVRKRSRLKAQLMNGIAGSQRMINHF